MIVVPTPPGGMVQFSEHLGFAYPTPWGGGGSEKYRRDSDKLVPNIRRTFAHVRFANFEGHRQRRDLEEFGQFP